MARLLRVLLFALMLLSLSSRYADAQVQTGIPQFGSYAGGPDVVNLANLNVNLAVPVRNKAGRGSSSFSYNLIYDSSIWQPLTSNGTTSWVPTAGQWGWQALQPAGAAYVTYALSYSTGQCGQNLYYQMWAYSNFQFFDSFGVTHTFPGISGSYMSTPGVGSCPPSGPQPATQPVTQTDGTGYTMYATMQANSPTVYLIDKNGTKLYVAAFTTPPTSGNTSTTDRNGNIVSQTNGIYTDTLNTTALSVIGSAPSNTNLTYTAPSGANASYVVSYRGYIVRTAFGCSGITEYNSGSTQIYLVDKITLPDASFYQFNYEQTPGYANDVTGRVTSVTLPTGGQINYTYTGGSSGHITCADGSASGLTRQTPDGAWSYARTAGTGAAYTTTITDPSSNQTVVQFQGIYETQRVVKQGSSTALQTVNTCYNGSASPCIGTAVTLPFSQISSVSILPGTSSLQTKKVAYFNGYGLPTEVDEYDYGSGAPPATPLRKTFMSYAALGNGIVSMPASVTVQDGTGATKASTTYTYDQSTPTATSGTPQHIAVSGSRGNATTITRLVQGSTSLINTSTYYDTGNVRSATDVNGAVTTFNYSAGSCGNSFPTTVSEPLSLSKSMTWNCTGGVQLSATDENSRTVTTTYNDPNFWRPVSVTDPLTNVMSLAYGINPASITSSLTFNGNQSTATTGIGFDGLGRQITEGHMQAPGSINWDQVTYSYDSNGRAWKTSVPCVTTGAWTCPTTATTTTYDALNRPLQTTDAGGGTITNSYSGNDVLVTVGPAPSGENTKRRQLEYDALGRLTSVCEITGANGSGTCGQNSPQTGFWTKYSYDALGNLTSVTQNAQGTAQTRSYSYDLLSRLTSETNPESGTTAYSWDSATGTSCVPNSLGDMIKKVDANGNWTCYIYDALHRLTDVGNNSQSATNPCKRFRYDNSSGYPGSTKPAGLNNTLGRVIEATTDACSTSDPIITDEWFSYTARGEVSDLYESMPHSGGYYHTSATYWANGVVNQLTGPGSYAAAYNLDGEGRVYSTAPSVGALNSTVYNAASQPTQVTFYSGDSDAFTYDPNTNRLTQYKFNVNGQSVIGILTWNPIGTLASLAITDPFNSANAQTCNYSHDDLTRIASVNCGVSKWQQNFSYDAFGNITKTVPTGSTGYSFQPTYSTATNRMTTIGGSTPSYDASGNVLNDFLHSYAWDAYGRPITIDGVPVTYDALGRMVEQNQSGAYSEIVYAPDGTKIEIMNGQSYTRAFVPLPGGAVAVYSGGIGYYRHPDHLGSSRFASTTNRTMYYDGAYAPFGEPYAQTGNTDLSFTGKNQDTAWNLYDFPAREYGIQGRWASPDPAGLAAVDLGNPQSLDRYAYVRNNPLGLIDPFGLYPVSIGGCEFDQVDFFVDGQYSGSDLSFIGCDDPFVGLTPPRLGGLPLLKGNPKKLLNPPCPSGTLQAAATVVIAANPELLGAAAQAELLAQLTGNVAIVGVSAGAGKSFGENSFFPKLGGSAGGTLGIAADPKGNLGLAYGYRLGGGYGGGFNVGASVTMATGNTSIFQMSNANVAPQGSVNIPISPSMSVSGGGNLNGSMTLTVGTGRGTFGLFGGAGQGAVTPLVCTGN